MGVQMTRELQSKTLTLNEWLRDRVLEAGVQKK